MLKAIIMMAFLLGIVCLQNSQASNCGKVIFGGLDWDSSRFHVAVAKILLEQGYGCQVEVIPGSTLPLLSALGSGDVDVLMEVWKDNYKDAWSKLENQGKVVSAGVNFPDAIQGWYVPTYLVKGEQAVAPNLKSVSDLVKYKKLFKDPEDPSKGRFLNCILGWSCEDINTKKLKAYKLNKDFTNFRPGTGAALAAAIASQYEQKKPFVAYYWGPTWVLGKYDLTLLKEPPFDPALWERLTSEKNPTVATQYPVVKVHIGVNKSFADSHPTVMTFLKQYKTTSKLINQALSYMEEENARTPHDAALSFLSDHEELWQSWVGEKIHQKVIDALAIKSKIKKRWKINISEKINRSITWLVHNYGDHFKAASWPVLRLIIWTEKTFLLIPWWAFIVCSMALSYFCTRKKRLAWAVGVCFVLIYALDLWYLSMQTLALMIISTFVSIVFGLPLGIISSKSEKMRSFLLPILDTMQTMPSFVYLIPALMLFGLGKVPAVFATIIYSIVPIIRLTDLGIRNVDRNVLEAAESFGSNYKQLLFDVKLPLALPSIMAGINQTTMLALSMVVIASMIGARGLGEQVLLGIQKLNVGQGLTAGIGIVLLAIILDRITQGLGKRFDHRR